MRYVMLVFGFLMFMAFSAVVNAAKEFPGYAFGEYTPPLNLTGGLLIEDSVDGKTLITIAVSSTGAGAVCEYSGYCTVTGDKIFCTDKEMGLPDVTTLRGTVSEGKLILSSGEERNVCDSRGSLYGTYTHK